MNAGTKRSVMTHAALAGILAVSGTAAFAADTIYIGPSGGTWGLDPNWQNVGPDGIFGTGDDTNVEPGAADAAVILDGKTVNLSTPETVLEVQVSVPANPADTSATHGTARLNVLPGATLTTNGNTAGIRVGRALDAGQALGTSRGEIIQTGGSVIIQQGSNGLRLSQSGEGNVSDSLYQISGGSVRGGAGADGTMVSNLALGTITNNWGEAEFHVVGSAPTSIRFLDVALGANNQVGGSGTTVLHFSLDAGGVTPIIAEDELQWRGTSPNVLGQNLLEIDLIGEAPQSDITLILADRLNTNGATSGAANEHFSNYLEGAPIQADFGTYRYHWTLDYTDPTTSADNGILDASVVLRFQSREIIPEPTSLALLGAAGLMLARRRRTS
jgi:hypothetical protein